MGPSNIHSVLKGKVKDPIPKCRRAYCPSWQHIMMHPFMKCLNGQQLWHFTVVSVCLFSILPALNVTSNLQYMQHGLCIGKGD